MRIALLGVLAAMTVSAQTYEVFAIRYGTLPQFRVAGLVAGADRERRMDIALMVWLVRGGGRTILVDAGFYREHFFRQWKVADYIRPSEALSRFGVKPEEVTDVIITHLHWDHADGFDLFPNARVWIQKDELEYYAGSAWQSERTHGGVDPADVVELVKWNTQGRVKLVAGDDQEILPGIRCYTGGRHTWASQFVGVNTSKGTVVLASDNAYLYENLDKRIAIAATLDAASNVAAQDRMKRLAGEAGVVVPGHDPEVMLKFPEVATGVVKIR